MNTDQLARLIDERCTALAELRVLAARQLEAVRQGDLSGLFPILAEKQAVIEVVAGLEGRLAPYRDEDPEQRPWPTAAERQACAAQWRKSKELLAAILTDERLAEVELTRRRSDVAEQLRGHHQSAEARRAYAQAAGVDGRGATLADG